MKLKILGIIVGLLFISTIFFGCIEDSHSKIKYSSTETFIPNEKQGKMIYNFTIRTNEETEKVRLWIPYPVSNNHQNITNYYIVFISRGSTH